jgi:hypothetical protein
MFARGHRETYPNVRHAILWPDPGRRMEDQQRERGGTSIGLSEHASLWQGRSELA